MKYKLKYKKSLILIALLIIVNVLTFVYYGLWSMAMKNEYMAVNKSGCTDIIYSDNQDILLVNPKSLSDEDGLSTIPNTITLTNNCKNKEVISLYLDIYNDSTINDGKLKINVNGDATLDSTFLDKLNKLKGYSDVVNTYKIVKIELNSNETKRINFRLWLDYNAALSKDKNRFHAKYYILSDNEDSKNNFMETILSKNQIASENGLIKIDDSYYFNGVVENNNVKFADMMWKILAINPDGSIKLIYAGDKLENNYNDKSNEEKNVSFENSTLKQYLDDFYNNKLNNYDTFIKDDNYCNDTSSTDTYYRVYYGAYNRNFNDSNPTIKCPESNKEYGGNKNYKIALITLDEAVVAGLSLDNNENNFLVDGNIYYTMSPIQFNYRSYVAVIDNYGKIDADIVSERREIRPVITLVDSLEVDGDGTLANPYLIKNN